MKPDYVFVAFGFALLIALLASWRVWMLLRQARRVRATAGVLAADAADRMLTEAGIAGVSVEPFEGYLSDYFEPRQNLLRLSVRHYPSRSIEALGVAAHEVGHALQAAEGYSLLSVRGLIAPWSGIGGNATWIVAAVGLIAQSQLLVLFALMFFAVNVLLQIVNLPAELNASRRGLQALHEAGLITDEKEESLFRKALSAAAWTHVAGTLTSILTLRHLLPSFGTPVAARRR